MWNAENLALTHAGRASSSAHATDDSVKDIDWLLEDHTLGEDGPYPFCSSYTGRVPGVKYDWWAISFPQPVGFNCVRFTHGRLDQGGGYWTDLQVQVRRSAGSPWQAIQPVHIYPAYDLEDWRGNRRSFETHAIVFARVAATEVRLYGRAGGSEQYTTLFHLGVYDLDTQTWGPHSFPPPPVPRLFRLLQPESLAEMLFDLEKVTGIMMAAETPVPMCLSLGSYLSWESYQRFVALDQGQTTDPDEFESMLFEAEGGDRFMPALNASKEEARTGKAPVLHIHHGGLASLVVPVVVGGQVIGLLTNCTHFFCDGPDIPWHRAHARELGLQWEAYRRSMARLPSIPRDRLEAMLHLSSIVANTIAQLADASLRSEQRVREMEETIRELSEQGAQVVDRAVAYMAAHLDQPLALREVAAAVAVSPRHLMRLARRFRGRRPMDLLIEMRLERAAELLRVPGRRVTDVCNEVGYSSLSYFVRLFTRRFGVSPGRYARQAGKRPSSSTGPPATDPAC